jgi:hypothetical protein
MNSTPADVRQTIQDLGSSDQVAPTEQNYFTAFLRGLGAPVTQSNLDALYGVAQLEGINDRYNPLNVIQPEPGSTPYNSVGVQQYADFDTGVEGAVTLFQGPHWAGVRAALARGNDTRGVLDAFKAAYTWDPGVQFPTGQPSWGNRLVGPQPGNSSGLPSGSTSSATGSATFTSALTGNPFPGGGFDPLNWPSEIGGAVVGGVLKVVLPFATKAFFVLGGLGLVVLGLYRASQPTRDAIQPVIEKAAAAAA